MADAPILCVFCCRRGRSVPATCLVDTSAGRDFPACTDHAYTWSQVFMVQPRLLAPRNTTPTPLCPRKG